MKDRNKLDAQDTWDLTKIFKDSSEFYESIKNAELAIHDLSSKFKGCIMASGDNLYDFLTSKEKLDLEISKIELYAHLLIDLDTTNNESKKQEEAANKILEIYSNELSFVTPEILKGDYSKLILENKKLEPYEFMFHKLFRKQNHILSEKEEAIMSGASSLLTISEEIFKNIDNADINLGYIKDETGKKVKLNDSNYSIFIRSKEKKIRQAAFKGMYKYYSSLKYTLAANYLGKIKENFFFSKIRNYSSPIEASLFQDNIDINVYENLIKTTHEALPILHRFFDLKAKYFGIKNLHMYDVYLSPEVKEKSYTFKEAKTIVIDALKPLGEEYINILKEAFENRWIDVYPSDGKRSGAYANGSYGFEPHVLLNFNGEAQNVSTLAHEMGHALHSYYANQNQSYTYSWYTIFLAEIASTVNEVLLGEYLLKNTKNKEEKIAVLFDSFERNRATLYRQVMFAEFEKIVHEKYNNNIALTTEELCNTYYELNKQYFGDKVISDEEIRYEWMRIPHFYSSFYVYKYATGLSAAFAIAYELLNGTAGFRDKYLNFLKSGGSKWPLDTLKELEIDLSSKQTIEKAYQIMENKVKQLEDLLT